MILQKIKDFWQGKSSFLEKRSNFWPEVRKLFLKKYPNCNVCNGTSNIEVHHIQPFVTHPNLELDYTNLITLCESKKLGVNCHLFFGHLGNYQKINPSVNLDVKIWSKKLIKELK